ncbi:unnamed protein product [Phytophthora fragariaefolia]|uniref:Unnamed protein product n=1 Tax=Phytophthora fragariaefolia TaxID=1490495 RepID=A0A9W6YLH6_9STRA|nr:unnamed protein product [Phytophthora fragariaefolia]
MPGSKIYSAIDLTDGFYQILMRTSDIPLTAVSTPSGMLWEWLVIPQCMHFLRAGNPGAWLLCQQYGRARRSREGHVDLFLASAQERERTSAMARFNQLGSQYNFVVHYKLDKSNILANALSRRPDCDPRPDLGASDLWNDDADKKYTTCVAAGITTTEVHAVSPLRDAIVSVYDVDAFLSEIRGYLRGPSEVGLGCRAPRDSPNDVYGYPSCDRWQTERVNRVLVDVLRSYATSFESWGSFLPLAEFALNNAVHASTGLTPFFVNHARHPHVLALLAVNDPSAARVSTRGGGGMAPSVRDMPDSQSSNEEEASAPSDSESKSHHNAFAAWATNVLITPMTPVNRAMSVPTTSDPVTGAGSTMAITSSRLT